MTQEVNWYTFSGWFFKSDTYKNNFSYDALRALYDYLEEYEESTGETIEFDPIALCCEWSEYDNIKEVKKNYTNIKNLDDLKDHTQVIELDKGGLLVAEF
jgi:hypothetical protein